MIFHYLNGINERYSGFKKNRRVDINNVLQPAVDEGLIQICYMYDKFVFSHAGVTKTWVKTNNIDLMDLDKSINDLFVNNIEAFNFTVGRNYDESGDDITQPPIWVRIPSLLKDGVDNFTFVVGHSTLKELTITDKIIGVDTIGTSGEYLVINGLTPIAKKIANE